MPLFEPNLNIRPRQAYRIDPGYLAQILSAPQIAKEQAKQDALDKLAQLPQNLFDTASALQQYRQQQALNPLIVKEAQAKIEDINALAEQRRARADSLLRIKDTAAREPSLISLAASNLRNNPFYLSGDESKRAQMLDQEISILRAARQKINNPGNTFVPPPSPSPLPPTGIREIGVPGVGTVRIRPR